MTRPGSRCAGPASSCWSLARDWGEAFAARNLALLPALDALLNVQFAELAKRNADEFLALLFAESGVDSQRSQDWSATLVRYALERRPELAGVLAGQLAALGGRVAGRGVCFGARRDGEVADAVLKQHRAYLELCGL
jgi:hypothetical protein